MLVTMMVVLTSVMVGGNHDMDGGDGDMFMVVVMCAWFWCGGSEDGDGGGGDGVEEILEKHKLKIWVESAFLSYYKEGSH